MSPSVVSTPALAAGPQYQLAASSRTIGGLCSLILWCGSAELKIGSNTIASRRPFSRWNFPFHLFAIPSPQIFRCRLSGVSPVNLIRTLILQLRAREGDLVLAVDVELDELVALGRVVLVLELVVLLALAVLDLVPVEQPAREHLSGVLVVLGAELVLHRGVEVGGQRRRQSVVLRAGGEREHGLAFVPSVSIQLSFCSTEPPSSLHGLLHLVVVADLGEERARPLVLVELRLLLGGHARLP